MLDIAQGDAPQRSTTHSIMPVVLTLRNGVINHPKTERPEAAAAGSFSRFCGLAVVDTAWLTRAHSWT